MKGHKRALSNVRSVRVCIYCSVTASLCFLSASSVVCSVVAFSVFVGVFI